MLPFSWHKASCVIFIPYYLGRKRSTSDEAFLYGAASNPYRALPFPLDCVFTRSTPRQYLHAHPLGCLEVVTKARGEAFRYCFFFFNVEPLLDNTICIIHARAPLAHRPCNKTSPLVIAMPDARIPSPVHHLAFVLSTPFCWFCRRSLAHILVLTC